MRKLIAIILVLIGFVSQAQTYLVQPAKWRFTNSQRFDSTVRFYNLPLFTGDTIIGFNPLTGKLGRKILTSSIPVWGTITGTLSNQTDLQNALNAKQATLTLTTTGTSGAATLTGATLNIPQYSGTTYTGGNGIIVSGSTIYRDSLKTTGQYGNTWGNGMYLGSSNNRSVRFRVNGLQKMVLDSNGNITTTGTGDMLYLNSSSGRSTLKLGSSSYTQIIGNGSELNIATLGSTAITFGTNSTQRGFITSNGDWNIGNTSNLSTYGKLSIPSITASANYGTFSLSNTTTAFDGSTTGKFVGSTTGQYIAINSVGSVAYNFLQFSKNGSSVYRVDSTGKETFASTITAGGTTGDRTINKPSGTVNIAAAGTSVTVTNSLVSTSSIVVAVVRTNDTTAYIKNVVPSAGSFVITLGAAATAEVSIGFIVYN